MHFELNQDQKLLWKMIREFAEEEVAPGAEHRDKHRLFHHQ
ncbi:hypothetical protein GCM10010965_09650 [Caldalkalibacillus thermarum]|nr:acyl-CoA dehydrogenase family protein [Caldalkalibacillus thermarum]GGK18701.1 hypothetical protein GCM10010965_09650 [Caldalkalibacillus thermarum]